jgi:hypothetical protein
VYLVGLEAEGIELFCLVEGEGGLDPLRARGHISASPADLLQRLNKVHSSLIYTFCGTMFAPSQQISFSS